MFKVRAGVSHENLTICHFTSHDFLPCHICIVVQHAMRFCGLSDLVPTFNSTFPHSHAGVNHLKFVGLTVTHIT